jgi:hypothetical protein
MIASKISENDALELCRPGYPLSQPTSESESSSMIDPSSFNPILSRNLGKSLLHILSPLKSK